jgi:hypothetical protein
VEELTELKTPELRGRNDRGAQFTPDRTLDSRHRRQPRRIALTLGQVSLFSSAVEKLKEAADDLIGEKRPS